MPHRGTELLQLAFFLFSATVGAAPSFAQSLTLQGRVTNSSGQPITGSATVFRVQIVTPNANACILYDESQTLNLSSSEGLFSLSLNNGTGVVNSPTTYTLEQSISNFMGFSVSSAYCQSGSGTVTYSPAATDNRKVIIQFKDPGTMSAFESIPAMDLNPHAYAMEARTVGGFPSSSLLRVVDGTTLGSPATLTSSNFTELLNLINGTSANYMSSSSSSTAARLPTYSGSPTTPASGSMWYDTSSGTVKFFNGSATETLGTGSGSGTITGVTTSAPLSGSGSSGSVNISLSNSGVTAGSYGGSAAVPVLTVDAFGRVTAASTATISGVAPGGTAGGDLSGSYPSPTVAKLQGVAVSATAPSSGQVMKYNGTNWSGALLSMSDIYASDSTPVITNAACTSTQSLYLDSVTGHFECQSIGALSASAITTGTLAAGVMPAFTGDATSSAGSTSLTLAASGATAGTYKSVTVDAKGRVLAGTNPTTLGGFGITDGVANAGAAISIQAGAAASIPAAGTVGRIYIGTDNNTISYDTGSSWTTITSGTGFTGSLSGDVTGSQSATVVSKVGGVTAANVASGASLANAATNLNTASTIVKRDPSGNFAAGAVSEGSSIYRDSASNSVTLSAPSTVTTSYSLTLPPAAASANGQILSSTTAGVLSWASPSSVFSTSVTAPITNSGTATAPNIGITQATTSASGYLSSTDWTTFNAKLSSALTSAYLFIGNASNVAMGVALSGDATLTNAGALTVTGIKGKTVSAAPTTAGQVLRYDGTNITPNFLSMADLRSTVTGSSALTTGCTASQTLTWNSGTDNLVCQSISVAAATQITGVLPIANGGTGASSTSQNFVFAGPSGAAGAPTFRALTAADLPASASYWNAATGGINYAGGNVGIGTTAPSAKLDVAGGVNVGAGDLALTRTDQALSYITRPNTAGAKSIGFAVSGGSALDAFNIYSTNSYFSGNVGIGTTAPASNLQISGSNSAYSLITLGATPNAGYYSQIYQNLNTLDLIANGDTGYRQSLGTNNGSGYIRFFTAGFSGSNTERMRIDYAGNVGIGTTSPVSPLQVHGATNQNLAVYAAGAGIGLAGINDANTGAVSLILNPVGGNVGIGTTAPTAALNIMAGTSSTAPFQLTAGTNLATPLSGAIEYDGTYLYYTDSSSVRHTLAGSASSGTQNFANDVTITGSGTGLAVTNNETVGGTLAVTGATTVSNTTASTSTGTGALIVSGGLGVAGTVNAAIVAAGGGTASAPSHTFTSDLTSGMWQPAASNLALSTGGTERMRILSSGNVGIGTTGPVDKLDVENGNIYSQYVSSSTSGAALGATALGSELKLNGTGHAHFSLLNSAGVLEIGTTSGAATLGQAITPSLSVMSNGNVGIGTTAPSHLLSIQGASSSSFVAMDLINTGTGGRSFSIGSTGAGNALGNGYLSFYDNTATASRMIIDPNGNVGIGTTAPISKLEVNGAITADNGHFVTNSSNGAMVLDTGPSGTSGAGLYIRSDTTLGSITPFTDLMTVLGTGNVGIGTTSPTSQLNMIGSTATSATITLQNTGSTNYSGTNLFDDTGALAASFSYGNTSAGAGFINQVFAGSRKAADFLLLSNNQERMRITSGGNVGIGTTAPAKKFGVTVNSSSGDGIQLDNTNASSQTYFSFSNSGTTTSQLRSDYTGNLIISSGLSGSMYYGFDNNNTASHMFYAGGSQRMIINSAGNVGVGTSSPGGKLEILQDGNSNTTPAIRITGSSGDPTNYHLDVIPIVPGGGGAVDYKFQMKNQSTVTVPLYMQGVNGNVGIGTTSPSYTLHVVGTAGLSTGTAWTNASDIRLKDVHGDYEYGLAEVLKLHTIRYNYKKKNALNLPSDHAMTGFIAQEVQKVIPDAVHKREDGYLELNVDPIHWAVVNAVQQLYHRWFDRDQEIRRDVASLRSENERLKARTEALEKAVCELNPKAKVCVGAGK